MTAEHSANTLHDCGECHADACQQGRRPCPCPEACHVPTDAHVRAVFWRWWLVCMLSIGAAATWAALS